MALFVGTDIGGTFTDIVGFDSDLGRLVYGKSLTNKADLVAGVLDGLKEVGLTPRAIDVFKHGSTQIINTLLERKGARTALVTTRGFRDLLEIGRAGRPVAFDLDYTREAPLADRTFCLELAERVDANGQEVLPIDAVELDALVGTLKAAKVESVAVSFLNAYINPGHEQSVTAHLRENLPGVYVTAGHELSREWYEYERTSTAVANAYVGPLAAGYVDRLASQLRASRFDGNFFLMGSNGGVLTAERAKQEPIALVESGPIGGCVGAASYARLLGLDKLIAFDMGGTTAKCALVESGVFDVQAVYYVGGYERGLPLRTPVLDIVEVGTGGGSIAAVDNGRLSVGPKSAGSDPGPACFGQGGTLPTVTDANLVLGRISAGAFLDGALPLSVSASCDAIMTHVGQPLGYGPADIDKVAGGIVTLANAQMATAIREITIERGKDARQFTLFLFGGGGPLHGIELARQLRIRRVVIPAEPGNFSALGMLFAQARVDETQSCRLATGGLAAADIAARLQAMTSRAHATLARQFGATDVICAYQAEMRFRGQKHSLRVPFNAGDDGAALEQHFLAAYLRKYGHFDEGSAVDIIALRVVAMAPTPTPDITRLHGTGSVREGDGSAEGSGLGSREVSVRSVYFASRGRRLDTPIFKRAQLPVGFHLTGPAVIEEFGSTIVIGPGDTLTVGQYGEIDVILEQTA